MDIHQGALRVQQMMHRIQEDKRIPRRSRRLLQQFCDQCCAEGLQPMGIYKYLHALRYLAIWLRKPLDRAKKRDLIGFVSEVEKKGWTAWTKHGIKVALKKFYKWVRGTDIYPEEVRWIVTTTNNDRPMLPEELLTEEEVKALVQHAENPRDKALVAVLYESGARVGEVLGIRRKHVAIDEYGAVILVNGKTGDRRIRLIASAPLLAAWLQSHPLHDPEAFVWLTKFNRIQGNAYEVLGYAGLRKLLRQLAQKAGVKKRVYPHLFRHSRATALANRLTEAQLKELFGWTQGSNMASIYIHLSGRDVDNALLELHGLSRPDKGEEKFKVKLCPRCQEKNSPDALYCLRCALPLDIQATAWEDKVLNELFRRPEVRNTLKKALLRLHDKAGVVSEGR